MVGDDVQITIVEVRGNHVRVGVTAPRQVGVHRSEVYKRIQAEKTYENWKADGRL